MDANVVEVHTTTDLLKVLRVVWTVVTANASAATWSVFTHVVTGFRPEKNSQCTASCFAGNCLTFEEAKQFAMVKMDHLIYNNVDMSDGGDGVSGGFIFNSKKHFCGWSSSGWGLKECRGNRDSFVCDGIWKCQVAFDVPEDLPMHRFGMNDDDSVLSLSASVWKTMLWSTVRPSISKLQLAPLLGMRRS